MSEPARSIPHDAGGRTAPGPLRDWLSAMKTHSPAEARPAPRPEPVHQAPPTLSRAAEGVWSPRVVEAAEEPVAEVEDADLSELMAENLMLKAKLRLEADRQDALQAMLADEIRGLREHIRDEIGSLEELRAEQEKVRVARESLDAERARSQAEFAALRAERDQAAAERDALRAETLALAEERDLWRARTEALAQPLFQLRKS